VTPDDYVKVLLAIEVGIIVGLGATCLVAFLWVRSLTK
jgi:hypothetical protein